MNKIYYANIGNQTIASGSVSFDKDVATTITSISQSGTVSTPTGFTYDFTNLLPFYHLSIEKLQLLYKYQLFLL